jgi:hypothetical protein
MYVDVTNLDPEFQKLVKNVSGFNVVDYATRVKIDTTNFNKLVDKLFNSFNGVVVEPKKVIIPPENKYLFLLTFNNAIKFYTTNFTFGDANSDGFKNNKQISLFIIELLAKRILDNIITFFDLIFNQFSQKSSLVASIQTEVSNAIAPIITYVKIRINPLDKNKPSELKEYNSRFKGSTDGKLLLLDYNDHNIPYYIKNEQSNKMELNKKILLQYNALYKSINNIELFDKNIINTEGTLSSQNNFVQNWNYKYAFGPFTRVFSPNESNSEIADKANEILSVMLDPTNPKPVMMLGYGASGAGKTSSLIYWQTDTAGADKQGILMHLCKRLGEKDYKKINVRAFEFYTTPANPTISDPVCRVTIQDTSTKETQISFTHTPNGFQLSKNYNHKNEWTDRIEGGIANQTFPAGTDLGIVLLHVIDTDRYVKATTNNPNSSRSHAIISVEFVLEGSADDAYRPVLLIGDFAGVENTFACSDPDVLRKFVNIKAADDINRGKYFYKSYAVEKIQNEQFNRTCPFEEKDMYAFSDIPQFIGNIPGLPKADEFFKNNPGMYITIEQFFLKAAKIDMTSVMENLDEVLLKKEKEKEDFLKIHIDSTRANFKNTLDTFSYGTSEEKLLLEKKIDRKPTSTDVMVDHFINMTEFINETSKIASKVEESNEEPEVELIKLILTKSGAFNIVSPDTHALKELSNLISEIKNTKSKLKFFDKDGNKVPLMKKITGPDGKMTDVQDYFAPGYDSYFSSEPRYAEFFTALRSVLCPSCKKTENFVLHKWNPREHVNESENVTSSGTYDIIRIAFDQNPENDQIWQKDYDVIKDADLAQISKSNKATRNKVRYTQFKSMSKIMYTKLSAIVCGEPPEEITNPDEQASYCNPNFLTENSENLQKFWKEFFSGSPQPFSVIFRDAARGKALISKVSKQDILDMCNKWLNDNELLKAFISEMSIKLDTKNSVNTLYNKLLNIYNRYLEPNPLNPPSLDISKVNVMTPVFLKIKERILDLLNGFLCKYSIAKYVCSVRLLEGVFINDSLTKIRSFIKVILDSQLSSTLNPIPLFDDMCFKDYCSSGVCFDKSNIAFEKYQVHHKILSTLKDNIPNFDPFNLVFSIFCVFNLSHDANNPPPIPYIDINKLKKLCFMVIPKLKMLEGWSMGSTELDNIKKETNVILKDLLVECYAIRYKIIYEMADEIVDKLKDLKNKNAWGNFTRVITVIEKACKLLPIVYVDADEIKKRIFDKVKHEEINVQLSASIKASSFKDDFQVFFSLIDDNNAASALGTLEFVDLVSKYYSTTFVCQPLEDATRENTLVSISDAKFPHQIETGGGKGKSNKSKSKIVIKSKIVKKKNLNK